ncbi:MAG: UbiD family decarboxylase [Acidimicrobiia bacterium]|nr:UbiD family decarboxylase [Acidimicrobiia bacterium]
MSTKSVPMRSFWDGSSNNFRAILEHFENVGRLARIKVEVDPIFEIAAVCRHMEQAPDWGQHVVLFENVKGSEFPIVGNLCDTRDKLAFAMGTSTRESVNRILDAMTRPIPVQLVDEAPCHEVVITEPDLGVLPIPTMSEFDGGPYISAGLHLTSNPLTGVRNAGIQRNQVHDSDLLGIYMAPTHMLQHYLAAKEAGSPLPVAIALGVHPSLLVSSQLRLPFDTDELAVAGSLMGEAVRMVPCVTIDAEAPADAEVVIEGEVLHDTTRLEGPFGEFARLYGPERELPVVKVRAITHRRDALYHNVMSASSPENVTLGAVGREPSLLSALRSSVPTVRAVRITIGGGANFHAIVAMQKNFEGEPQKVGFAAFAAQDLLKHVYVVDEDIDIFDDEEVHYALATRMDPARDMHVIENVKGNPLDPVSVEYGPGRAVVNKMIMDATVRIGSEVKYRRAEVPAEVMERVGQDFDRYLTDE